MDVTPLRLGSISDWGEASAGPLNKAKMIAGVRLLYLKSQDASPKRSAKIRRSHRIAPWWKRGPRKASRPGFPANGSAKHR